MFQVFRRPVKSDLFFLGSRCVRVLVAPLKNEIRISDSPRLYWFATTNFKEARQIAPEARQVSPEARNISIFRYDQVNTYLNLTNVDCRWSGATRLSFPGRSEIRGPGSSRNIDFLKRILIEKLIFGGRSEIRGPGSSRNFDFFKEFLIENFN